MKDEGRRMNIHTSFVLFLFYYKRIWKNRQSDKYSARERKPYSILVFQFHW